MKINNRQKLLYIVTAVVVGLFIGDQVVFSRLTDWWHSRATEITKLKAQIRRGEATIASESAIRAQWADMRTNALPNDQGRALEKVSGKFREWAEESGVSVNGVSPAWKTDQDGLKTVVCRVDASGTLWMLSRFIYDVENDPLGLKVESMDVSARDNTGQTLGLSLNVSGLVLSPQ